MTKQEIFNIVGLHLLNQNKKSTGDHGNPIDSSITCKYRGSNNLRCAVGCLIPDEEYTEGFEGDSLFDGSKLWIFFKSKNYSDEILYLMQKLQTIHDLSFPCVWKEKLILLGEEFELNLDLIKNFKMKNIDGIPVI